jgi:UDP-glucose 4-epimerase
MLFKNKNVLVTGGAGFIGSNLTIRLAAEGANVTVLDSMLPDYGGNLFNLDPVKDKIHINFSDMRDSNSLSYVIREKDYIFNLAGQVSHQDSMVEPLVDMEINVKAQLVLLEACRRYNPSAVIVYASTRQFYGKPEYLPVDELHPLNPTDVNGIDKLAGELYHILYSKVHSLRTTALRLTNTYGPRQLIKNARQGFIGWFINRVLLGEKIHIFGTGEQIRDFNYVEDVVEALIKASQCSICYGQAYNLSGEQTTLMTIAEKLITICGKGSFEIVPFPDERKKIDIGNYFGSSEKFYRDSMWKPLVHLDDGLAKTIEFYSKFRKHYLEK